MNKTHVPSFTELKKALNGALVNPKTDKMVALMLQTGNSEYYLQRVMELIQETLIPGTVKPEGNLNKAIMLLAAAKVANENS